MSVAFPPDQALILNRSTEALFRPFQLKGLTVKNRIVMAPMTRSHSPGGIPGPNVAAYYRRRTEGGVGLIITEGTFVDHPVAGFHPEVPRFHGEQELQGWKHVVEQVHAAGGLIFPQLWHVGMVVSPEVELKPGVTPMGPATMTTADIDAVIHAFVKGAQSAMPRMVT
jgi:2,4-dienoyl-CoA reductase-like NADH-dependent reductase (Old Yellow Enzyme family)